MRPIYKDLKILVVDDDAQARALAERSLLEIGFSSGTITFANDGEEARELLKQNPKMFELILIDMVMPRVSGLELLEWIQQHPDLKTIPKITLSSQEEQSVIVQAIKFGAQNYLVKPVESKLLARKIISLFT